MVLATINRTPQSFALAIVGAEYLMRWLPRGTHDWRKFLRPSELAAHLRASGARLAELAGVRYSLITGRFSLSDDLSVNYMALALKVKLADASIFSQPRMTKSAHVALCGASPFNVVRGDPRTHDPTDANNSSLGGSALYQFCRKLRTSRAHRSLRVRRRTLRIAQRTCLQ